MSKNKAANSLIIDDYKNDQKEDYMNIAKHNEENFETKQFEKFKPRNAKMDSNNLLKGEENKLKKLLFSILKNEENKTIKTGKFLNNYNDKSSNTNSISSIENVNQLKKPINKNYKQFKKNSKSLKLKTLHKIKKPKLKILYDNNFTSKNINSNFYTNAQKNIIRSFSFENSKSQKELQYTSSSISNNKKSRNNYSSLNKSEKDYSSDYNQTTNQFLSTVSKNPTQKTADNFTVFINKKV